MAGEDNVVGGVDDFAETGPVDLHFSVSFVGRRLTENFLEPGFQNGLMGAKDFSCRGNVVFELGFQLFERIELTNISQAADKINLDR